jgi:PAS domain-containing protein
MSDQNLNSLYPLVSDDVPATLFAQSLLAAFDALPDAVYLFDEERVLTKSNLAGSLFHGCSREELLGMRCCEMFWRTEDTETCVVDRALESGERIEVEIHTENENKPTADIVQPLKYG